jgi:hypothetical protein
MPVPFFTQYEVSSEGRVRNTWTGRTLKPFKGYGKNGRHYRKVNLYFRGCRFSQFVHRLVMMAFYEADHVDRNREHNCLSNIQPVLRKENDKRWRDQDSGV